jgi:hypothetical protein
MRALVTVLALAASVTAASAQQTSTTYGPNGQTWRHVHDGNTTTTYAPHGQTYRSVRDGNMTTTYGPNGQTWRTQR